MQKILKLKNLIILCIVILLVMCSCADKNDESETDYAEHLKVNEYSYKTNWGTIYYYLEVTNQSDTTLNIWATIEAKDKNGEILTTDTSSMADIISLESGYTSLIRKIYTESDAESFKYTLQAEETPENTRYLPFLSDITYEVEENTALSAKGSLLKELEVKVTNNGNHDITSAGAYVLLFKDNELVGDRELFFESGSDSNGFNCLKAHSTASDDMLNSADEYDHYKIYFDGKVYND